MGKNQTPQKERKKRGDGLKNWKVIIRRRQEMGDGQKRDPGAVRKQMGDPLSKWKRILREWL